MIPEIATAARRTLWEIDLVFVAAPQEFVSSNAFERLMGSESS